MKDTSWSLSGPPRTLTRSALMLTKRGIDSPLATASLPAHVGPTADVNASSATNTARNHAIILPPIPLRCGGIPTLVQRSFGRIAPGALGESAAHLVERRR